MLSITMFQIVLLLTALFLFTKATPCVKTDVGNICGFEHEFNGSVTSLFYGIPYAQAITNDTRFMPNEPSKPFSGDFQAKTLSPRCSHLAVKGNTTLLLGQLDCLQLNIFVPTNKFTKTVEKMAVMFFIHGEGSARDYFGWILSQFGDVIVVTTNYRLGIFGFGYLPESPLRGNVGLLDQRIALQWVNTNIAYFGGNPDMITIFGEGAGSASVTAHIAAPASQKLFKHAIAESGSILCQWAMKTNPYMAEITTEISRIAGCSQDNSSEIFACLNGMDTKDLLMGYKEYLSTSETFYQWLSPVENDELFFGGNGHSLLNSAHLEDKSIIIGTNGDEGGTFLLSFVPAIVDRYTAMTYDEYFNYFGQKIVKYLIGMTLPEPQRAILEYYSPPRSPDFFNGVLQLFSDFFVRCSAGQQTINAIRLNAANTYSYMFNHTLNYTLDPINEKLGPFQGSEVAFVFGAILQYGISTEPEKQLSRQMMTYWTNLAKFGKTTGNNDEWPTVGKQSSNDETPVKVFDVDKQLIKFDLKKDECNFWKTMNQFLPENRRNFQY